MGIKNRCQRCGGNLLFNREEDGGEWRCLQCGRCYAPVRPSVHPPVEISWSEVRCAECDAPIPSAANPKRRYCSDRCRMRAARRRWAEERVAV
jgi:endogenous inhibitor of DNA gyrase (YacG/DUF329 family)